jgi:hypothetical protein
MGWLTLNQRSSSHHRRSCVLGIDIIAEYCTKERATGLKQLPRQRIKLSEWSECMQCKLSLKDSVTARK